jgi:cobalt-zinc-cadmium efflux system outer membrane protein
MRAIRNALWVLTAVVVGGCTSLNPGPAFDDLSETVHARTGKRVRWIRGTAEDAEVARAVQSLLRRGLTVDAAVQVALLNNRDLQQTYEELGVAQADLVEAGLLRNPVLTFERRWPGLATEADIAKIFIDILLLPLRKRVAAAEFETAKMRVGHEILTLAADVRGAFYGYQGDQQLLEMRRTVATAMERSAETALLMNEAGNITNLDLANEQAQHVEAKIELARAQTDAVESREKLSKLMGVWGQQTGWTVNARLPNLPRREVSPNGLESRAVAQRLDLAAARADFVSKARSLGFARVESIMEGGEITAHFEREQEGDASVGPSFSIPLPIFNQGQPAVARARSKLRQSQQSYLSLATDIRSDVRTARDRMLLLRSQVEYYKSAVLPIRNRVVNESQLQYNAMQIGPIQLLQAKQEEIRTGVDYIETLRDYWVARAELEKAVGGNLTGKIVPAESSLLIKPVLHQKL